jgi:choline-glycine betaine transporter
LWFVVFGGAAIDMQLAGGELWNMITSKGVESATFAFFSTFPLGTILVPVFLITICISFTTLADSMTSCVASMSTKGLSISDSEAPIFLKVLWGVLMGAVAWIMISFAGIDGFKMVSVLAGFPIVFLMLVMVLSTIKGLWFPETKFITWGKNSQSESIKKA